MTTRRNDETELDPGRHVPRTQQQLLDLLTDEFLSRLRSGERPSIQEFQRRHPGLESEIEEILCSAAMIEDLKRQSETVGRSAQNPFENVELERIGDYRIVRELGRGGMGIVFEAIHESLGRKVAIKVLPSRAFEGTQAFERFKKEAQAAAKLHHSNIVNVFGVGECDGFHYYVMEYVNGQTLDKLIARFKDSPQRELDASIRDTLPGEIPVLDETFERCLWSAEKISQIADALEYSHLNQILHRDIKPGNILVDHAAKPWITDFGLVKELSDQGITKTGEIFGTPQYMAPESFEGSYDQRSEVYCLGLTLYELLALKPAFFDASPTELFKMIATGSPKCLRQIDPQIPRDLETIVDKAIDRDPTRRYQTAGEFRDDLERFKSDLPVRARRVLPTERAVRWAKRNPLAASLTALSVVLLLVVAAVSGFAFVITNQALADLEIKHNALTQQQKETTKAVLRAEANVTLSMKAFDQLFKKIMTKGVGRDIHANMELETYSELSAIESSVTKDDAKILKGAIEFYRKFTEQNQGNAKLNIEIAKAHRRIANTFHFIGDLEEARKGYFKAIEVFEEIVAKDTGDIGHVVDLAETHNELALAFRKQKRFKLGLEHHENAKCLLLQDQYSGSQACQFVLANTLNSICTFGPRLADPLALGSGGARNIRGLEGIFRSYMKSR
ncbi:MAG: protein kinase, partial [Planctomycetota bacterium]|nr:protein kinase [Planctomycetota bacterium]